MGWRWVVVDIDANVDSGGASRELDAEGDRVKKEPAAVELPWLGRSLEAELRRLPSRTSSPAVKDEGCIAGGCSELAASWRLSAM